jgi:hypothetical protein
VALRRRHCRRTVTSTTSLPPSTCHLPHLRAPLLLPTKPWRPRSCFDMVCYLARKSTTHHAPRTTHLALCTGTMLQAPRTILNPLLTWMPHIPKGRLLTECAVSLQQQNASLLVPPWRIRNKVYLSTCLLVSGYPRKIPCVARLLMSGYHGVVRTPCLRIRELSKATCTTATCTTPCIMAICIATYFLLSTLKLVAPVKV